jgi:RNA polymerase sigma-70 factor (ECF subfamily)
MTTHSTEELVQSGFRYAYSLTHHAHDAEDLVQAAWLKLQRAYGQVENRMLLFTAIRNLFYDGKRREKIVRFESAPDIEDRPDVAQESGMRGDVEVLLGLLEPGEREILFLNCVEGYTAREIGEAMEISRNTVLGILARSKRKLQEVAERETARTNR